QGSISPLNCSALTGSTTARSAHWPFSAPAVPVKKLARLIDAGGLPPEIFSHVVEHFDAGALLLSARGAHARPRTSPDRPGGLSANSPTARHDLNFRAGAFASAGYCGSMRGRCGRLHSGAQAHEAEN